MGDVHTRLFPCPLIQTAIMLISMFHATVVAFLDSDSDSLNSSHLARFFDDLLLSVVLALQEQQAEDEVLVLCGVEFATREVDRLP